MSDAPQNTAPAQVPATTGARYHKHPVPWRHVGMPPYGPSGGLCGQRVYPRPDAAQPVKSSNVMG